MEDLSRQEDFIHYLSKESLLCGKCRNQLKPLFQYYQIQEMKVFAFYEYNRFFEGMLFQYKEGRDTALKDVFFFDRVKWKNCICSIGLEIFRSDTYGC